MNTRKTERLQVCSKYYIRSSVCLDNRTYHFQAEDEADQRAWLSVLVNCKEGALYRAFDNEGGRAPGSSSLLDLQQSIINYILRLPSNDRCCDCNSTNGRLRDQWMAALKCKTNCRSRFQMQHGCVRISV